MKKEDVKEIIDIHTEGYKTLVDMYKKYLRDLTEFSLEKVEWNHKALESLFEKTDEPELEAIKETLKEVKGYLLETFRDAHLENKTEVKEWHDAFVEDIEALSGSQHRNTFR